MTLDITVKIGGEAGQGIQTIGSLLALACQRAGLYIIAINDFESRIRGGHNFFQIRISDRQVRAPHDRVDLLVGLDTVTSELHRCEVVPEGLIIKDSPVAHAEAGVLSIPITELAKKAGGEITANTVAAGVCLSLLGAPFGFFQEVLAEQFSGKSQKIIEENLEAARLGYEAAGPARFAQAFDWKVRDARGMLLSGDQAFALGALAGDCRFVAYYPMSPATGISLHLTSLSNQLPLVVEQVEDEIAAVHMAIGAAFAGVRSMTATSGGGFCLMTEGLGLAGITETPIVIIDAQRPGPATGLPTRTGQGDLHFVIRASQDEFPRFVFAPGTPEDAYEITAKAFHLSEKYQVPAIILADQYLIDSLYVTDGMVKVPERVERFVVQEQTDNEAAEYKRYAITPSGVSPRALPCRGKALVVANGNEHHEDGDISEAIHDRNAMVDKRNAKLPLMVAEIRPPQVSHGEAHTLLVGWGSTFGVINEVVDLLRNDGLDIGHAHFTDLWPFPRDFAINALGNVHQFFTVESNSSAQFAQLIRQETSLTAAGSILKYDGRPFYRNELYDRITRIVR